MSLQVLDIGSAADDGTGESLRSAGSKLNTMLDELYNKSNDIVNVTRAPYSAVGDGSTDDTTAIQDALDENTIVYIPTGTWRVDPLTIPSGVRLWGAGVDKTILKLNDGITIPAGVFAKKAVLMNANPQPSEYGGSGTNDTGIIIHDLTLDGNKANITSSSSEAEGLSLYGAEDILVLRVKVINAIADGFDMDFCRRVYLFDVIAEDCDKTGIHFSIGSPESIDVGNDDCLVRGARILNCVGSGLSDYLLGGQGYRNRFYDIFISGCGNEASHPAAFSMGGKDGIAENIFIRNTTGNGFSHGRHGGTGGDGITHYSNKVSGLNVQGSSGHGALIDRDGLSLEGYFEGNNTGSVTDGSGIRVESSAKDITIQTMMKSGGTQDYGVSAASNCERILLVGSNLHESGTLGNLEDLGGVVTNVGNISTEPTSPSGGFRDFVAANSEYFSLSHVAALENVQGIAVWVNYRSVSSMSDGDPVMAKDAAGANEGDFFWVNNGTDINRAAIQGTPQVTLEGPSIVVDTWDFIVLGFDGSGSDMYVDGTLVDSDNANDWTGNTNDLLIGERNGNYFDGRMFSLGLFTSRPDSTLVASLWNQGAGKRYADLTTADKTDLLSWYDMDEASGNAIDSHGSNDLTDNNTVGSGTI